MVEMILKKISWLFKWVLMYKDRPLHDTPSMRGTPSSRRCWAGMRKVRAAVTFLIGLDQLKCKLLHDTIQAWKAMQQSLLLGWDAKGARILRDLIVFDFESYLMTLPNPQL